MGKRFQWHLSLTRGILRHYRISQACSHCQFRTVNHPACHTKCRKGEKLYMWFDILVSADPFFDQKATLQQSTTSSDFCFAICCQISINCMLSILHVCNLTAHKNQAHKRRNAQFFTGKWKQKKFEFFFFFF